MDNKQPHQNIPDRPAMQSYYVLKAGGPDDGDQSGNADQLGLGWLHTLLEAASQQRAQARSEYGAPRTVDQTATVSIRDTTPVVIDGKTVPKWLAERMNWNSESGFADLAPQSEFFKTKPTFREVGDHIVEERRNTSTGVVFSEMWWNKKTGQMDRPDGKPACIDRDSRTGAVTGEQYWTNDKPDRNPADGPAFWHKNFEEDYWQNGRRVNRPDGGAGWTMWNPDTGLVSTREWYENGKRSKVEAGPGFYKTAPGVGRAPADATTVFLYSPTAAKQDKEQHAFTGPNGEKTAYTDVVAVDGNIGVLNRAFSLNDTRIVGYGKATTPTFTSSGPATKITSVAPL